MGFENLDKPAGLAVLNNYLEDKSYIAGFEPSQADSAVFAAVTTKPTADHPHALRWYNHIAASNHSAFPGEKKAASAYGPAAAAAAPAAAEDEDDIDLFGSDDEEVDEEAEKLKQQRLAEYHAKKSAKPKNIAKSMVILDVKPWDDETDMKALEEAVLGIEMEGLVWGARKFVPIGYGIKKLQVTCVIEDDKVGVDDLSDQITGFEDYVQSVDVAAFNKL
ncbi:Elongation factor 1-beta [Rhizophlyctis rosea]|uniref:Elongation factor 1-beta n=1 Tax=Rhizophlyctis rosea TaxID=64517 RepID=A0AAD5SDP3_9FUNG|nr:Elongation factor 1-beta [Rhizophlyctis rosea]